MSEENTIKADHLARKGIECYKEGKYEEAIDNFYNSYLSFAFETNNVKTAGKLANNIGICYGKMGDRNKEIYWYDIGANYGDINSLKTLCLYHAMNGNAEKLEEYYSKCYDFSQDCWKKGDSEKAIEYYLIPDDVKKEIDKRTAEIKKKNKLWTEILCSANRSFYEGFGFDIVGQII